MLACYSPQIHKCRSQNSLPMNLYRWLSRVHVIPIILEHIDTFALQSLFVLLLKPLCLFCCSLFCPCGVIAYLSSFVAIDLLGVWRIELTGCESEEPHWMEEASDTLIIFYTYIFYMHYVKAITLCMSGYLYYCCCKPVRIAIWSYPVCLDDLARACYILLCFVDVDWDLCIHVSCEVKWID